MSELVLSVFEGEESAVPSLRDLRAARPSVEALGSAGTVSVDEEFLARAREALVPGTSAVAMFLGDDHREPALRLLASCGGTLVRTSPSTEQDAELERELGGLT